MVFTKIPMLPLGESIPPTTLNPRPFLPAPDKIYENKIKNHLLSHYTEIFKCLFVFTFFKLHSVHRHGEWLGAGRQLVSGGPMPPHTDLALASPHHAGLGVEAMHRDRGRGHLAALRGHDGGCVYICRRANHQYNDLYYRVLHIWRNDLTRSK